MSEPARFDADYFDALYRADPDPWNFETSPYEARKYAETVAVLGERRFRRGLEVGCSIGVLTRDLAPRVDALVALDISALAIETARARNPGLIHVSFVASGLIEAELSGAFDLMVFSEVLYYLTPAELAEAAERTRALLEPGGEVVLVNWLGKGHHPLSGDQAADGFRKALGPEFRRIRRRRRRRYRLDLLRRPG